MATAILMSLFDRLGWLGIFSILVFFFLVETGFCERVGGGEDAEPCASAVVNKGNSHDTEGRPLVALTFDDGPHPELTPQLLDILQSKQAVATFYVIGRAVKEHPEIINRAFLEGHEIGNHTWSHPDMRKLSAEALAGEINKTTEAISRVTGEHPYGIRPPYGAYNRKVLSAISPRLWPVVMWTVDPLDWKKPGSKEVARRVLEKVSPGAIILLHDIHLGTIQAVPSIIEGLLQRGYRLVTVSEILAQSTSVSLDSSEHYSLPNENLE
jgi:peptidoglycan/xylan/chitin deacetylase (PgdA/CDA1 family)